MDASRQKTNAASNQKEYSLPFSSSRCLLFHQGRW